MWPGAPWGINPGGMPGNPGGDGGGTGIPGAPGTAGGAGGAGGAGAGGGTTTVAPGKDFSKPTFQLAPVNEVRDVNEAY
jgi:hypothetical protein